jgi:iron complex transport system substrate-binding protein
VRIVSVLPSATEIVFALGAGAELVGRSAECDHPRAAADLPVVMRPRTLDADRPSGEIDRRVRAARGRGESLYELDLALLQRLRPDVLLTQDLCGVCSVTEAEVQAACRETHLTPRIVSLSPRTLAEVWTTVERVGEAIGRPDAGRALAAELRSRSEPTRRRPAARVAVLEWLDPPILAGLWTPSMIRAAGGEPLGPAPGEVGRRTTWPEVERLGADLTVLSPCSFSVPRSLQELRGPRLLEAARRLARGPPVVLADEAYFSRPGPRLADGVELLRALLAHEARAFPMPVQRLDATLVPVAT